MTMGMQANYYMEFRRMLEIVSRLRCGPLAKGQLRRGLVAALALARAAGWVVELEHNGLLSRK